MANIPNTFLSKFSLPDMVMGDDEAYTMEHRLFNMGCTVTIAVLFVFISINIATGFWMSFWLCAIAFVCEVFFYYYSRFKKRFLPFIVPNAIISYAIITANYFINSGITGPTMFLFFLTFVLLIASTPVKMHFYWLGTHVIVGSALIILDIARSGLIDVTYANPQQRYIDTLLTAIVTLVFIYVVTKYLRNYYIKEKQKAETSKTRLQAFFESSSTSYLLLNTTMQVMYFNKATAQFVQGEYQTVLEEGMNIEPFINAGYSAAFKAAYKNALLGHTYIEEKQLFYKNYGPLWLHLSFAPVLNTDGAITGVSFACEDITKQRESAVKIADQNNTLLNIAFLQSHELRQPVSSILGLLNLIKDDGENKEEYLTYLQDAVDELDAKLQQVVTESGLHS